MSSSEHSKATVLQLCVSLNFIKLISNTDKSGTTEEGPCWCHLSLAKVFWVVTYGIPKHGRQNRTKGRMPKTSDPFHKGDSHSGTEDKATGSGSQTESENRD